MNRNFVLEIHTHTLASGHAYGTIREMVQAAEKAGLQLLGISEHAPGIPGTVHPAYYLNLDAVPRKIGGVELLLGCEVNVLNGGKVSLEEKYWQKLDYALVGIHSVCYRNEGMAGNTDNLIACMQHEKVFFVSHPDDSTFPLDYERLVQAAKQHHVALEVNNKSLRKPFESINCEENYANMLGLCKQYGVPIIVNTDAHDPSLVGDFAVAYRFLETRDFPEELILNCSVDRLKAFLGIG